MTQRSVKTWRNLLMPAESVGRRTLLTVSIGAALALGGLRRAVASPRADIDPAIDGAGADRQPSKSPSFADVSQVEPWDALLFLAGRHPRYPGATLDSLTAFAPADILETMDTVVVDAVAAGR